MTHSTSYTARAGLAALLLAVPIALASPAHAQGSATATEEAAALFQQGKTAFKEGRFPDAYEAYKRAWSVQKGYDIAGNLGNVEVKLGRYRDAIGHLQFVLDNLPPSIKGDQRARALALTNELLNKAKAHVAMINVAVTPNGATITLDNVNVGTTPFKNHIAVEPGEHKLVATLEGHLPLEHTFSARAGSKETVRMPMVVDSGGDTTNDSGPSIPLVVAGSSLAVVGIGVGAVFLGLSAGEGSTATEITTRIAEPDGCTGDKRTNSQERISDCDALDAAVNAESTFFGLGVGLLTTGAIVGVATLTYALWPRDDDEETGSTASLPVTITPVVVPGFSGISVSGSF